MEFAHQIRIHHYRLPKTIPLYTAGGNPFAYPPLPFYTAAFTLALLPLSSFMIANLLPPFIAILSMPAFYLLTSALKLRPEARVGAMLAYATMPNAFFQQVESAGLAEAFGVLSLTFYAYTLAKAHDVDRLSNYALAGATWALCVLSAPGTAYGSTLMFLAFALSNIIPAIQQDNIQTTLLRLTVMGLVAVTLSSPYWLTVTVHHGFRIFLDSLGAQQESFLDVLLKFLMFDLSGGAIQFWWNLLVFSGLLWTLIQRRLELLAWFILLYSIPREGQWMAAVPGCLLAGLGIAEMMGRFITRERVGKVAYVFLWVSLLIYSIGNPIREVTYFAKLFSREEWADAVTAMTWTREHLPPESQLVVLSKGKIREWAPHLTRHTVLNVDQGTEWVPEERAQVKTLNSKLDQCPDLNCIVNEIRPLTELQTTYLLLDKARYGHLYHAGSPDVHPLWENASMAVGPIISTQ